MYAEKIFEVELKQDENGRIVEKVERMKGKTYNMGYEYDDAGRLSRVLQDRGLNESYQYDEKGRRMSEICGARGIFSKRYQYTFDNRLFAAGNIFYEHDEDGFRSSREENGQTTHYRYSPDGRLLQAELQDGTVIRYRHHNGQRVAKLVNGRITEAYQWLDRIRLGAAMVDGSPMQFHYDSGRLPIAMTHDGATYSLHYDQVGSLRVVADTTGNVIKEVSYTSFGNILNDSNSAFKVPIGFAGGLHDRDTGFVRFGFRDYDPETGRFTALDPIGAAGGDDDWYGYCLDDPVNAIDPIGLMGGFVPKDMPGRDYIVSGGNGAIQGAAAGAKFGLPGVLAGTGLGLATGLLYQACQDAINYIVFEQ